jgi:hypothetical protein
MFNIYPVASEKNLRKSGRPIWESSGYDVIEGHDDSVKTVKQNPLFARVKILLAVH